MESSIWFDNAGITLVTYDKTPLAGAMIRMEMDYHGKNVRFQVFNLGRACQLKVLSVKFCKMLVP